MSKQRWSSVLQCLIPALVITVSALIIAGATGGIIALVLVGLAAFSALLVNVVLSVLFVSFFPDQSPPKLVLAGLALYIVSLLLALGFWNLFGPSQIM